MTYFTFETVVVEESKGKYIMRTKINHKSSRKKRNLLECINVAMPKDKNGKDIQIPIKDQNHQGNVCAVGDRFIRVDIKFMIEMLHLILHSPRRE
jgi:hypothetical protein